MEFKMVLLNSDKNPLIETQVTPANIENMLNSFIGSNDVLSLGGHYIKLELTGEINQHVIAIDKTFKITGLIKRFYNKKKLVKLALAVFNKTITKYQHKF